MIAVQLKCKACGYVENRNVNLGESYDGLPCPCGNGELRGVTAYQAKEMELHDELALARLQDGSFSKYISNGSKHGDDQRDALIRAALRLGIVVQISGSVDSPELTFIRK